MLTDLVNFFAQHGYFAVLAALLLCGAGLPLPEDITLVAGGVISGLGYTNVHFMCIVALFGVLAGDMTMFLIGHLLRSRVGQWPPMRRFLVSKRFNGVQKKFDKYGNRLLFIARFLPGARTAVFITAGLTHRVSVVRFLLFDGAAALISVPVWVYLGYVGADNREWLVTWVRRGETGIWAILITLALSVLGYWLWRRKRRKADGEID